MSSSTNFGLRVPLSLLYDPELKPDEKVLYGFLAAVPNHDPSYTQISSALGYSRKRTSRALKALNASGWITSRRSRRIMVNGRSRFGGTTKYTLRSGRGRQFILMVPQRRESLIQALPRRSAATALLVALYEQYMTERRLPQPTNTVTAASLGISHDSLSRARTILGPDYANRNR